MRVQDMMRKAVTVGSADTIASASRKMRDAKASSCLVVDGDLILGVLTERDVVTKLVAENRHPGDVTVRDLMTAIPQQSSEQARGRIMEVLGSPASALEDAEGAYEMALTGAPIDFNAFPGAAE